MGRLKELTIEANLGSSKNGSIARASLSSEGLRIVVAKGDTITELTLDSEDQVEALRRLFETRKKDLGFVQVKFETYSDPTIAKQKLEAAEAKVESLQCRLSWIDNPERMGG